jgi:hypothetical protein
VERERGKNLSYHGVPTDRNESELFSIAFPTPSLRRMRIQEYAAAARLLEPLCNQGLGISSPILRSAIARIYLQGGYIEMASKHFAVVADDLNAEPAQKDANAALLALAYGEWGEASEILAKMVAEDADNFVVSPHIDDDDC